MAELHAERMVDVLVAEYDALRAEIVTHITIQGAVVGLGVTAIGVIAGLAAKEGGDYGILLIVPPLSLFITLIYSAETYRSAAIEIFIYERIWPSLESQVGTIPSWELSAGYERRFSRKAVAQTLLIDLPATAIFLVASAGALIIARHHHSTLRLAGLASTGLILASLIAVGQWIQKESARAIEGVKSGSP